MARKIATAGFMLGLTFYASAAGACSICSSNISYNMMPFTAIWAVLLLGWVATVGGVYWSQKRRGRDAAEFKRAWKSGLKYLGVLAVLYVFGQHLVALLWLPVFLFLAQRRMRPVSPQLFFVSGAFLIIMAVTVPVGYAFFPKVASEPETRARANKVKMELKALLETGTSDRETPAVKDEFAYTRFEVPVLNWAVMALDESFYWKAAGEAGRLRVVDLADEKVAWSRGPDGDFDLSPDVVKADARAKGRESSFAAFTYDPTNGCLTGGDLIAVKVRK